MSQAAVARFDEKSLSRVREALKEFHRKMRKAGIHPRYDISAEQIIILIPVENIVTILKNTIESVTKGYVKVKVSSSSDYITVVFKP